MNVDTYAMLFQYNSYSINANTENITHEESLRDPGPGGNCINWVLGHIVSYRNDILELLGAEPAIDKEKSEPYLRGTGPLEGAAAVDSDELLSLLKKSQEVLDGRLKEMKGDDLDKPAGDKTVGARLAFLQFHETYHAGQLGVLRRILGKKGAI